MNELSKEDVLNLLNLIPEHTRWIVLVSLVAATAFFAILIKGLTKGLDPDVVWLELKGSIGGATSILVQWGEAGKRQARRAVIADFFFIPTYAALSMYLCFWAAQSMLHPVSWPRTAGQLLGLWLVPEAAITAVPWLAVIGVVLGWSAVLAGMFDVVENIALLRMLRRGASGGSVRVTKFCASCKFAILGVILAFLVFRVEYFVYEVIAPIVGQYPLRTISVLLAATVFLGLRFFRLVSRLHPSILSLHLARSRSVANRVLHKWSSKEFKIAVAANKAEMVFAVAYAVTLAIICFRISPSRSELPLLNLVTRGVAWYLLLAGTLHLVQNLSTAGALQARKMGWWFQLGRSCGTLRLVFLAVGAGWLFFMFMRWEVATARRIGERVLHMMAVG